MEMRQHFTKNFVGHQDPIPNIEQLDVEFEFL